jgi:hypothetical protein
MISGHIDRYGQHLVKVFLTDDDPPHALPCIYTIGNHERRLPELLIVAFNDGQDADILNHLAEMQRKRGTAFRHGEEVSLGGTYPVRIVAAGQRARDEYAVQIGVYYHTESYDVRQVLYCDPNGRFPGDPGCEEPYCQQPDLSRADA